jgi:hypothetical protein
MRLAQLERMQHANVLTLELHLTNAMHAVRRS